MCVELKVTDEERGSRERGKQRIKKYGGREGRRKGVRKGKKEDTYLPQRDTQLAGRG